MREHETSARTYFVDLPDEAAAAARKVLLAYRPSTSAEPGRANLHADATLESIWNALTDGRLINPTTMAEAVASARAEGWQPIETAPKDGTDILVAGGHYDYTGWTFSSLEPMEGCRIASWRKDCWWLEYGEDFDEYYFAFPTHWMPLPAPPTLIPGGRTDV